MGDEGYLTLPAASISAALIGLLGVAAWASGLVIAKHQAQVSADLAAVAGAYAKYSDGDPCARANEVVGRNKGVQISCELVGLDVSIEVEVRGQRASATAGPL